MLQLFFEKTDLSDSVAPVRWCIDTDMAREVKAKREQGHETFAILFEILNEKTGRESRFVASLEEMMTFISFAGPDKNLVRAIVVYSAKDIREIKAYFLDKHSRGRYRYGGIFEGGLTLDEEIVAIRVRNCYCKMIPESGIAEADITVPKELFAKKPPKWLWNFANRYFTEKPFEQCDFRRKALYAIPIGLIFMPIEIIITMSLKISIALFYTLLGLRGINYRAVINPLNTVINDVTFQVKAYDSYFWTKAGPEELTWSYHNRNETQLRHLALWPLTPIFPVLLTALLWIASLGTAPPIAWPMFLIYGIGTPVAFSALILAFHGLAILVSTGFRMIASETQPSFGSKLLDKWAKMRQEKQERKALKAEKLDEQKAERLQEDLKRVICIGVPLVPKLEALPKEAKTIRLRFLDLKARVCRPYAE